MLNVCDIFINNNKLILQNSLKKKALCEVRAGFFSTEVLMNYAANDFSLRSTALLPSTLAII